MRPAQSPGCSAARRPPSDPQQAYLNFFALALHGTLVELRDNFDNRARTLEILDGLDILTENLRQHFGILPPPPNHPIARLRPEPTPQQLRLAAQTVGEGSS